MKLESVVFATAGVFFGLIAGWIAGLIMKGRGLGIVGDIIVGVIGALLGGFLFALLGVDIGGFLGTIIAAVIGAVILLFIISLIKRES